MAGDFSITVTGGSPSPASFPGSAAGTLVSLSPGAFSVSESGPNGYTESQTVDCSGNIALGQNLVCTITNDDVATGVEQLLENPGFEEEDLEIWEGSGRGGRQRIATEEAHGGTHVHQTVAGNNFIRQVFQVVAVVEGTNYAAAGWVRTNELGGEGASIRLVWFDGAGQFIRADILGTLTGTNDWTRLEGTFEAPSGAVTAWFNLYTQGVRGTAWFDDNELFGIRSAAPSAPEEPS